MLWDRESAAFESGSRGCMVGVLENYAPTLHSQAASNKMERTEKKPALIFYTQAA